ncbi:MAG: hypothetical protein JXB46_05470 [Candidatus Eisenbacteria bacterium]|nr:hypothetical protein [Candidatus Eisenbacteria bacterium]
MPLKKRRKKDEPAEQEATPRSGLVLVKDGVQREVSFQELALSNTLSLEALVRVLSRNGNIDPGELLAEMEKVKTERFRGGMPLPEDDVAH